MVRIRSADDTAWAITKRKKFSVPFFVEKLMELGTGDGQNKYK